MEWGLHEMTSLFPGNDFPVEGRSATSGFQWSLVPWYWVTFLSRLGVCVWWRMSFQTHILLTNYETTKKRDSGQYFRCPSGFNFMFVTLFSSPTLAALFSSATSSLPWRWHQCSQVTNFIADYYETGKIYVTLGILLFWFLSVLGRLSTKSMV